MRLADLYLLYAEAINEAEGGPNGPNSGKMFFHINEVRKRAGLEDVQDSWSQWASSGYSAKYTTQPGMRDIIRQERMIELFLEGQRFWDIRRWKTAFEHYRKPIASWTLSEYEDRLYYTPRMLHTYKFGIRDYFWPIKNEDIVKNMNLVQNIGW